MKLNKKKVLLLLIFFLFFSVVWGCSVEEQNHLTAPDSSIGQEKLHEQNPPVIWIVIDSLRGDVIGKYGITPHLEDFQKSAFSFSEHLVNASWTRPSTMIFFTGRYASREPVNFWDYPTPKEEALAFYQSSVVPLPKLLKAKGYKTFMIGNNPFLTDKNGLGVDFGFESLSDFSHLSNDTPLISKRSLDFLDEYDQNEQRNSSAPFFLFLNYNDPHKPYTPPAIFRSRVPKLLDPNVDERKYNYLGEVAYVDEELGKFFQKLKEKKIWDKSLIFITADHGEVMHPVHGMSLFTGTDTYFGHGQDLFLENIHVPLLMKLPFQNQARTITTRTQSIDLFPTILAYLGLQSKHKVDGISLLPYLLAWFPDLQNLLPESRNGNFPNSFTLDEINAFFENRPYYGETRYTQGIGLGKEWLFQKSYRFHRKGRYWESVAVGREPYFYYNTEKDPDQIQPVRWDGEINSKGSEHSRIQALEQTLRKLEPPLTEYTIRVNPPPKTSFTSRVQSEEIRIRIQTDAGKLYSKSKTKGLSLVSTRVWEWRGKICKPERDLDTFCLDAERPMQFSFSVYPDVSFPNIQIWKGNLPISREEWGVGSYDVNPESCQRNCEDLWTASVGEPIPANQFRIQIWKRGESFVSREAPSALKEDALEVLRKQGYVQ